MKKTLSVLFLILCLVLTGCSEETGSIRRRKKKDADETNAPRTVDISKNISDDNDSLEYEFDFDGDKKDEEIDIEIDVTSEDYWECEMTVSVGDYEKTIPIYGNMIEAVYVCDIDTEDGVWDLAIITNEMSGDPVIRVFNYASELPQHEFISYYDGEVYDELWLGYAINYYFNVNDDDTITLEMQTPSYGMWSVYRTYERETYGAFYEIAPEKYEILPDFMERAYLEDMSGEELDMWEKGYVLAYCDYENDTFKIEAGDYVKPLYDDGENHVYVEKEDGTGGWMYIGYDENFTRSFDPYQFNPHYFYLAG